MVDDDGDRLGNVLCKIRFCEDCLDGRDRKLLEHVSERGGK